VEQGHGDVPHVVGADAQERGHPTPGHHEAALAADHPLGRARRPRGEDQRPPGFAVDRHLGVIGAGPAEGRIEIGVAPAIAASSEPTPAVRDQHRAGAQVEAGQVVEVGRLGDHKVDIGVDQIGKQVLAHPGGVQAHDGRAGQRRPTEGKEIIRCVVEEHPDVGRTVAGRLVTQQEVAPSLRLGQVLGVAPHLVGEADRRAPADVGIAGVAPQQRRRAGRRQRCLAGQRSGRRHGSHCR